MDLRLAKRIATKARTNSSFVRWARILALIFVVTGSLDVVSTHAALAAGHSEANPIVNALLSYMGGWWVVPKFILHFGLACLILWIPSKRMLAVTGVVTAAYVLMVSNNFYLAGWTF